MENALHYSILGMSARLSGVSSVDQFWNALVQGGSLMGTPSAARQTLVRAGAKGQWGTHEVVRGHFLDDIDGFDRRLFSFSPSALTFADPRQRMLLEAVWCAIEDAGLRRADLAGRSVGVFVAHDGWYLDSYVRRIPPALVDNQEFIVPGNDPCFLANRISSTFDFRGPSLVFDSTCSGTYVALHQACRSLEHDECDFAVVGGVSLFLDPWADGKCTATPFETTAPDMRSFSPEADGYRTSEGCGAILLRRGSAQVDAEHAVHARILASGYNSGGKTNSFAQPSQRMQAALFRQVLAEAGVDPQQVGYVEAHGVATQMGDAVEANALIEVLQRPDNAPPCHVSTLKPNLGHNHASSGVYSLLKVVQAFHHGLIAPIRGLAASGLNGAIAQDTRGLRFAATAQPWPSTGQPRVALLSSYGLSNVNAALLLGAPAPACAGNPRTDAPQGAAPRALVCLSAQSRSQLRQQVVRLREQIEAGLARAQADCSPTLDEVAFTLQAGREAMAWRWTARVDSLQSLHDVLVAYDARFDEGELAGACGDAADWREAQVGESRAASRTAPTDDGSRAAALAAALATRDLATLEQLWCAGAAIDWTQLYETVPRRVHLPTYPFLRERYWVAPEQATPVAPQDHRTTWSLSGDEFFLVDHVIQDRRILPAVMHLEMVRAAVADAPSTRPGERQQVTLHNVVWARPLAFDDGTATGQAREVEVLVRASDAGDLRFELSTHVGDQRQVHSQGQARLQASSAAPTLALQSMLARMDSHIDRTTIYDVPARLELNLGARLRGIDEVRVGHREIVARLSLPAEMVDGDARFGLHPSLTDPILQVAYLGLVMPLNGDIPLTIPFALEALEIFGDTSATMWTWIRYAAGSQPGDPVQKLDVDLCDDAGQVCLTMRGFSFRTLAPRAAAVASGTATASVLAPRDLAGPVDPVTIEFLKQVLSGVLGLAPSQIRAEEALEHYGIDSLMVVRLTARLEETFGSLPKTLFFEYRSLRTLAAYFELHHRPVLATLPGHAGPPRDVAATAAPLRADPAPPPRPDSTSALDIAIVGLAGTYPGADGLEAYWNNLRNGVDSVTEIPLERWDWRDYYTEDRTRPGHHYSKWGGFIDDVDKFDADLFSVSPREAELMDPQERLFLQHAWAALEDAGYCRSSLREIQAFDEAASGGTGVGVYAGVMYGEYQLYGAQASVRGHRIGFAATPASIANRVSYTLDLHGPSMTVDTKCSSSLTALHLACQDLRLGHTSMAVAGGVNLSLHPSKYLELSRRQFVSAKGRCESFGEGGDGYVPGEGVGVAILKRLEDAERDGDAIYGVIKGSALNHGGKTNGYTVPNPAAQHAAIGDALRQAGIEARDVSYVEAHGTGTRLGDPIEIAGLTKAFDSSTGVTPARQACWIGSVKSNIGHCESAAGIAGVTKVLLQMKHRQIVPSLHSGTLNPAIDFAGTPFKVCQQVEAWLRPQRLRRDGSLQEAPRTAGVSSFGAGGANAHLLIQEHRAPAPAVARVSPGMTGLVALPLSARTADGLKQRARSLAQALKTAPATALSLADVAYTLQTGREPMQERVAFLAASVDDFVVKLEQYLRDGRGADGIYVGGEASGGSAGTLLEALDAEGELARLIEGWMARGKLGRVLELWVQGSRVDWTALHRGTHPRRVSLPTYPFAKDRHWVPEHLLEAAPAVGVSRLHPLLHHNVSTLAGLRFDTRFTGEESFFVDHVVQGRRVLPGTAGLEMARAAFARVTDDTFAGFHDVTWTRPVVAGTAPVDLQMRLSPSLAPTGRAMDDGALGTFELVALSEGAEALCMQGQVRTGPLPPTSRSDIPALASAMNRATLQADEFYGQLASRGLVYGATHRCIRQVQLGERQLLARLEMPAAPGFDLKDCPLHPALLDAALHATAALHADDEATTAHVPFALDALHFFAPCAPTMWVWVRASADSGQTDDTRKVDIDLSDEQGTTCVRLRGFASRPLRSGAPLPLRHHTILAVPVWRDEAEPAPAAPVDVGAHHVVLCELDDVDLTELAASMPQATLTRLPASSDPIETRFQAHATRVFELARMCIAGRQVGKSTLLQVVVPRNGDAVVLDALQALLKTACAEDRTLIGQLIAVDGADSAARLQQCLRREAATRRSTVVRHGAGLRQVAGWERLDAPGAVGRSPSPWKHGGNYLITGGLGGLGLLFAEEIARSGSQAGIVLCGRRLPDARQAERIDALRATGVRIETMAADVCQPGEVKAMVDRIVECHGGLHGVIHAAGIVCDGLMATKSPDEFARVLRPKIGGVACLDAATRHLDLDFFAVFSSVAGSLGNVGQADYATANAFLDRFAAQRSAQVVQGTRRGRSLSIGWPLWRDGGMGLDARQEAALAERTGMHAMPRAAGLDAFHAALETPHSHVLVLHGDSSRLEDWLQASAGETATVLAAPPLAALVARDIADTPPKSRAVQLLSQVLSTSLRIPLHKIRPELPFADYGIDSVSVLEMTAALEHACGPLAKTLFYEHRDVAALSRFLETRYAEVFGATDATPARHQPIGTAPAAPRIAASTASTLHPWAWPRPTQATAATATTDRPLDIAIIGLSGRYPGARDLDAFWTNLREGRDSIGEVPIDRWDWRRYFSDTPSTRSPHISKWGGFIDGVDEFDADFFGIPPQSADLMDPQERVFLEQAWAAVEDAGYNWRDLRDGAGAAARAPVGVYVGAMYSDYQLFGSAHDAQAGRPGLSSSLASIANRVSWMLDLRGPSMTIDSMCSSSLTAIHLACQDLRHGQTRLAIAGGVNLTLHPNKYLTLSSNGMISSEARTRSFGEGGRGYVPADGVGAVLLKRLADAERDGDHIHGVIKGSALSHGGHTHGYTVPGPAAQSATIVRALREAGVDARDVSCIEAHGTGTALGDPIEVAALSTAFRQSTADDGFCWLGSVKANIGHGEAAAGIAGLTKILLQLRHGELAPTIHAETPNANIDFASTPFRLNRSLRAWERPSVDGRIRPRIAGLSAFGAGGSNAHLVIEEYTPAMAASDGVPTGPFMVPLSARTPQALQVAAQRLLAFVTSARASEARPALHELAFVLQTGREAMDERLGVIATSLSDLAEKLGHFLIGRIDAPNVLRGRLGTQAGEGSNLAVLAADEDLQAAMGAWLAKGRHAQVLALWTQGVHVDWSVLHGERAPKRCSAPTYPFARERHWWNQAPATPTPTPRREEVSRPLGIRSAARGFGAVLDTPGTAQDKLSTFLGALLGNVLQRGPHDIDATTPLADLGLESIDIVRCTELLQSVLGAAVHATAFYEAATVGELAHALVERHGLSADGVDAAVRTLVAAPASAAQVFPLTDMQRAFLVGREIPTFGRLVGSTIYVELLSNRDVDLPRLEDAWRRLLRQHDALRIRVTPDFQQRIDDDVPPVVLRSVDLRHASATEREAARARMRREMSETIFDLVDGPCFDLRISHGPGEASIHLAVDEVLLDGYSVQLVARQLHALYADPQAALPELSYSYRQHLQRLQSSQAAETFASSRAYWQQKLVAAPAGLALRHVASAPSAPKMHRLEGTLGAPQWQALKDGAERLGCYPSTVLLTLFCEALQRYVAQPAFSLVLTNLNRMAVHRDVMAVAGLFINSTVFVHEFRGVDRSIEARLLSTQRQLADDAPHAHAGTGRIVRPEGDGSAIASSAVVFTSLVGSVFEALPVDARWRMGEVLNNTPQVHLDHQALEVQGRLLARWYVADAVHAEGGMQALMADYLRSLEDAARSAHRWSREAAVAENDRAQPSQPFALSNQQVAYAFGRNDALRHGGKGCVFHAEYDIDGVDIEHLSEAWRRVVGHHPMLRTTISSDGSQHVLQPAPDVDIAVLAAAGPPHEFDAACAQTRERMLSTVYPLDSYPYFTLAVCTRDHGAARLLVNIDLMVADGRSLMTIVDQLFELYLRPDAALAANVTTYRAERTRRNALRGTTPHARDLAYWRNKFEHLPSGPQCGRAESQVGARTRQLSRIVSVSELAQASRSLGCDAGTLLLAAYGQVLLEWNGGKPFSVVTVHWDRPSAGPSIDNVVGDFTRLGWVSFAQGGRTPADFVARVQRQLVADAAHRSAEGLEVLRQFKDLSFPVVFTDLVRPIDAPPPRRPGVRQVFCSSHTPQVTLDAIATPISDTEIQLQWDTAIDAGGQASEMFDRYIATLQRWAHELASETPVHEAAASASTLVADLATDGLHTLFERAAATHSDRCALRFADQALDYAELERRTAECAQWLRDQGVGPDDVVGVLMDRSIEMVVALLGIVRAGAAYLPVDVSFPRQRIALILGDAEVRCLLTQGVFAPDWIGEYVVLCLDDPHLRLRAREAGPCTTAGPRNLAYVIYTSGSTGSPKGCMIEHRSIVNRLAWMQRRFPLSPGDAVLQKTPYTFDVSVWEFFWPLIVGATLVVARPQGHLDGNYLLDLICRERIAVCHFVPSMLRTVLQETDLHRMAGLRHVMVSGEELDYDLIEEFHGKVPVALENLYGPTEAAVDVSHWHAEVNAQRHTFIGKAIDGIALHVLDEHLAPVPDGHTGELYIAGVGVGRGYLNNPALTARSFLPDPFVPGGFIYRTGDLAAVHVDGNILYHGRADTQVKLNGLRIELEEIEHHLRSHPQVKDAIVAVRELSGDKVLAAYVVPRSGTTLPGGLREFLGLHLPRYMLPHAWGVIAVVPVTAHGKRSRKDLPPPMALARSPGAATPHPVEKKLQEMLDAIVASAQRGAVDDGARRRSREVDQND